MSALMLYHFIIYTIACTLNKWFYVMIKALRFALLFSNDNNYLKNWRQSFEVRPAIAACDNKVQIWRPHFRLVLRNITWSTSNNILIMLDVVISWHPKACTRSSLIVVRNTPAVSVAVGWIQIAISLCTNTYSLKMTRQLASVLQYLRRMTHFDNAIRAHVYRIGWLILIRSFSTIPLIDQNH